MIVFVFDFGLAGDVSFQITTSSSLGFDPGSTCDDTILPLLTNLSSIFIFVLVSFCGGCVSVLVSVGGINDTESFDKYWNILFSFFSGFCFSVFCFFVAGSWGGKGLQYEEPVRRSQTSLIFSQLASVPNQVSELDSDIPYSSRMLLQSDQDLLDTKDDKVYPGYKSHL